MNPQEHSLSTGKVLLALDASSRGWETLTAAAEAAVQMRAEWHTLFVEDLDLLKASSLPFAQEVRFSPPRTRPLSLEAMEQTLRDIATDVRRSISQIAAQQQVHWSFHVVRGRLVELPPETVEAADLLILGGSGERAANRRSAGVAGSIRPVLVCLDGSPEGDRALAAGLKLVGDAQTELIVLLKEGSSPSALHERLAACMGTEDCSRPLSVFPVHSRAEVGRIVRRLHARMLLAPRRASWLLESGLESLIQEVGCPLGLVR